MGVLLWIPSSIFGQGLTFSVSYQVGLSCQNTVLNQGITVRETTAGSFQPGTRFMIRFFNVPSGVTVTAPTYWTFNNGSASTPATGDQLEAAAVIGAAADGTGGTVSAGAGSTNVGLTNGAGYVVYEVTDASASTIELITVPIDLSWTPDSPATLPAVGTAQIDATLTPPAAAPPQTFFFVLRCSTTLLFPYTTNQGGFDTNISIANTSKADPSLVAQDGACTLHYHGATSGGGAAPADQSSVVIAADDQLVFNFSGGNPVAGIFGGPGFAGYLMAVCEFEGAVGRATVQQSFGRNRVDIEAETVAINYNRTLSSHALLFDFVSNKDGFDTELIIANTTEDWLGTSFDSGTCSINVPGQLPFVTPTIFGGETYSVALSQIAPGFEGFASADCQFDGERGIARVTRPGHTFSYDAERRPLTGPYRKNLLLPHVDADSMRNLLVISNTSDDLLGSTTPTAGTCQISYLGSSLGPQSLALAAGEQVRFPISEGLASKGIQAAGGFVGSVAIDCDFDLPSAVVLSHKGVGVRTVSASVNKAESVFPPRSETPAPMAFPDFGTPSPSDDSTSILTLVNATGPGFNTAGASGPCTLSRIPGVGTPPPLPADLTPTLNAGERVQLSADEGVTQFYGFAFTDCAFPFARVVRHHEQSFFPNPDKLGVFIDGTWFRDRNGDFSFDPATEIAGWGSPGDTAVRGDWDGNGRLDLGVFSNGAWFLDLNGNGVFDSATEIKGWGAPGWLPITGDWNGDGKTDLGAIDPTSMAWFLDLDGDMAFAGAGEIRGWGSPGDTPVVGDWDGDGDDDIGVFSGGLWFLDMNGDGSFDPSTDLHGWGVAGWTPVVGDWNGDGDDDIGAIDPITMAWFRDLDGDFVFDGAAEIIGWGSPGDAPLIADWNGDGADDIGVFSGGTWFLDLHGDGSFDPATEIKGWGQAGWTPIPAFW